jgi:hypothetical protein
MPHGSNCPSREDQPQPGDEVVGGGRRAQLVAMDNRFRQRVERALAQERRSVEAPAARRPSILIVEYLIRRLRPSWWAIGSRAAHHVVLLADVDVVVTSPHISSVHTGFGLIAGDSFYHRPAASAHCQRR